MRVTSIPLECRGEPKAAALERALARLNEARGSDLVLLPELWPTGYFSFARYAADAEALDGPLVRALSDAARKLKLHLFMGSFVESDAGRLYNTSVLLSPAGAVLGRYRKMHLFGYGSEEQKRLCRGGEPAVAPTPWGPLGLATCYDLRFPELFRAMTDRGAKGFLVASAWPEARREAWLLFNRARAHENLAFLFSCNATGSSEGRALAGFSQLIDPWGAVLAAGDSGAALVTAEADFEAVDRARREFPALADRVLASTPAIQGAETMLEPFDPSTLSKFTSGAPYQGRYETGLYPGGSNQRPGVHTESGLRLAASIRPLDADGNADERNGRILAIVMGHSNCNQYFAEFEKHLATQRERLHPRFELLNCAVGGQQLHELLNDAKRPVWKNIEEFTARPGYSIKQVQALFLHTTYHGAKNIHRFSSEPFPARYQQMRHDLETLLGRVAELCPNLKLAYLTADGFRHHTGFEPHVWREAFGIRWAIERQLMGAEGTAFEGPARKEPWLSWGPYIWDNAWDASYFTDGVHPADKARAHFVEQYWDFLTNDPVARGWMVRGA